MMMMEKRHSMSCNVIQHLVEGNWGFIARVCKFRCTLFTMHVHTSGTRSSFYEQSAQGVHRIYKVTFNPSRLTSVISPAYDDGWMARGSGLHGSFLSQSALPGVRCRRPSDEAGKGPPPLVKI
jgi:hypothetical protein